MKTFLIVLISLLLSQCGGAKRAQKETAGSSDARTSGLQKDWKTVNVAIADLTSSLPPELSKESSSSEPTKSGDVTWTNYYYTWDKPSENPDLPPYEAEVSITNWDKGFPPEARGLSPEAMLELDYSADERLKNNGTAPIEELSYLDIDGAKASFSAPESARTKTGSGFTGTPSAITRTKRRGSLSKFPGSGIIWTN